MTASVFHQGKLMGDRKNALFTNPVTFADAPKVFISEDKMFAFGISGKTISAETKPRYEEIIRKIIENMTISGADRKAVDQIVEIEKGPIDFTHGIICTKTQQFLIQDIGKVYVRRFDGATHGCGTGGAQMAVMLRCGLSPTQAYNKITMIDHLSGAKFDSIDTSRLKPFVIKGDK